MARAVIHRHYEDYPDESVSPIVWILLLLITILVIAGLFFLYRAGTFTRQQEPRPTIDIERPGGTGGQGGQGVPGGIPSEPSTSTT